MKQLMAPGIRRRLVLLVGAAAACAPVAPAVVPPEPVTAVITPGDLRGRLTAFAHDSMMGREAGTIYNDRATDYLAAEAARIGLQPAGEGGTYFQRLPMVQRSYAAGTQLRVGSRTFTIWLDFLPRDQGPTEREFSGVPSVFGGAWRGDTTGLIAPAAAAGRVVVIHVPGGWLANRGLLTMRYLESAAVVLASLDAIPSEIRTALGEPAVGFAPGDELPPLPAFMYMSRAMADALFPRPLEQLQVGAAGQAMIGTVPVQQEQAPGARNVVAVIPGSDPALRGQYVAYGAHNDHVGFNRTPVDHDSLRAFNRVVRPMGADNPNRPATDAEAVRIRAILDSLRAIRPPRPDSIFNGADDDGSGSVALLAVAEAFLRSPPRRSVLFVWHTAEEAGLFGSAYFTDNPTVPRDSIVAHINVDMIGRGSAADIPGGGPGYMQAIGSRRHSTEFGRTVDEVGGTMTPRLNIDYQFDAPGHPQQYYCRSDHYNYARYGIPVAFFSTGSHPDYHQVTDEVQYIDFDKLALMARFIHRLGERVANQPARPVVDRAHPGPDDPCVQ